MCVGCFQEKKERDGVRKDNAHKNNYSAIFLLTFWFQKVIDGTLII